MADMTPAQARMAKARAARTGNPTGSSTYTGAAESGLGAVVTPAPVLENSADPAPVRGDTARLPTPDEIARIRAMRRPLGAYSQKLALAKRPGYHRHWFNDAPGRIQEAEDNGWTHVQGRDGKPEKRCVGAGRDNGALYAFAMEIPEVFWQEDQDSKHKAAAAVIEGTKGNIALAKPGGSKAQDKGKFYDPTESATPVQIETR